MGSYTQTISDHANMAYWTRATTTEFGTAAMLAGCSAVDYIYDSAGRFTSVAVPKNAVIVSAIFSSTAVFVYGAQLLKGEDADSPSAVTSYTDGRGRVRTTANVNPGAWTAGVNKDVNVKNIIEEITSRAGWVSGNSLILLFDDNGSSEGAYVMLNDHTVTSLTITYADPIRNNIMIF
jgi:hypothetical protein